MKNMQNQRKLHFWRSLTTKSKSRLYSLSVDIEPQPGRDTEKTPNPGISLSDIKKI